jgi:hypothetical protein
LKIALSAEQKKQLRKCAYLRRREMSATNMRMAAERDFIMTIPDARPGLEFSAEEVSAGIDRYPYPPHKDMMFLKFKNNCPKKVVVEIGGQRRKGARQYGSNA